MAGKCTNPEINSYMQVVGNVPESQPELSEWVEEFDHEKVNINFLNFKHLLDDIFFETFSKEVGVIYKKKTNSNNGNKSNSNNNNLFKNLLKY